MSFLCCDWCLNIFLSQEQTKPTKKAYKPSLGQDGDEQQLIESSLTINSNQLPVQYFSKEQQHIDLSNSLNVQLDLNPTSATPQEDKRSQSSKSETDNPKDLSEQGNQSDHQNKDLHQQITDQLLKPDFTKFSINLDPYHKHFNLLHEKTDNLEKYFTQEGKAIEFGQTKSNLQAQKLENNKFQVRFELPCSYSFYSMLIKDSNPNNKKYLTFFEKSQVLQAFKPNFTKNLSRFKRFNMLEPRQFVYLKYSNGSFRQNWQICINDPQDDLLSQQASEHKRCEIFSVGNFKQINDRLYVRQYVEVDLKSNNMNANIWGKIMHQVKQYYEKLFLHVQNYYQKELL